MNKIALLSLSLLAAGSGLVIAPAVRAEEPAASTAPKSSAPGDHGMMGGDMQGMMKKMARMNDMMDKCDRMMSQHDGHDGKAKK